MITSAAFRILIFKEFLLLTIIMLVILCHIWWLATLFAGIRLLFRSRWVLVEPDAVWFEATVGCDCQGIRMKRTHRLGAIALLAGSRHYRNGNSLYSFGRVTTYWLLID